MASVCSNYNNYSASKISKSGLKCFPYTFTMQGVITDSGISLKGLTPSISCSAPQQAPVIATPGSSCCG